MLDDIVEPQCRGHKPAVVEQPGAVDAARAAGAAVHVVEFVQQPAPVAHRRVGEGQHVVAERGRLRLLQIRLVRHQRLDVPTGERGDLLHQIGDRGGKLQQLVAHVDP